MKFIDIVKLKTLIFMFKASKNTLNNNILLVCIYIYKNCLFLAENIHLSGQKSELIENSFVFQLMAQNYGIIIIL